jgi:hypothetical protein
VLPFKSSSLRLVLSLFLLGLLSACDSKTVTGFFAPDPKLPENSQAANPSTTQPTDSGAPTQTTTTELPANFPANLPVYPQAQLLRVDSPTDSQQIKTNWSSGDNSQAIADFYQQQLQSNNWQLIQPFTPQANSGEQTLIASRDRTRIAVSILPTVNPNNGGRTTTEFAIAYQPEITNSANPTPNPTPDRQTPVQPTNPPPPVAPVTQTENRSGGQYLEDAIALGIKLGDRVTPEQTISRREFARWLVTINNKIYANDPGKQIRLATNNSQPVFKDISNRDSDFPLIQGLAEAGLIPSPLSGDSTASLFRPDLPLTRETLLAWKVPLDTRKALPKASIDSVKETWGFQDANKIDPKALPALYADYQNSEQSNIRRVFGYTTLFQPKKTVTHAEAAAALWYFGDRTDGMSARDALKLNEGKG